VKYRVIHKNPRTSKLGCTTTKTDTAERSISIGRESLQDILCTRCCGILAGFTARGSHDETGNKKAFRLEFAKTESIVTVQRRFRTMYHTETPTDKTIHEWYMEFQHNGCLCTAN
jgi:hypothetical protein